MEPNHDHVHEPTTESTQGRERPPWERAALEEHGAETVDRARKLVDAHPYINADTPDGLTRAINHLHIRDMDDYLDGLKWDAYINNDPALYNKAIRLELGDDGYEDGPQDHLENDAPPEPAASEIDDGGQAEPRPDGPQAPSFPLFENDLDQAIARARGAVGHPRLGPPDKHDNQARPDRTNPGPDLSL